MAINTGTAPGYSYTNITAAAPTTTVIRTGSGILHAINLNTAADTGTITVYDNTTGSGTKIATWTSNATTAPHTIIYDAVFTTGLTIVTATAAQDITVTYI